MRRKSWLPFLTGLLAGVVLATGSLTWAAVSLNVELVPLKFFIEGTDRTPKGGEYFNGQTNVPAGFIYQGTTYVPLRLLSELLGKTVGYRGQDRSIWVGKQWPGRYAWWGDEQQVPFLNNWKVDNCKITSLDAVRDAWGNTWDHGFQTSDCYAEDFNDGKRAEVTLRLDGRYKQVTGTLIIPEIGKDWAPQDESPIVKLYVDGQSVFTAQPLTAISKPVPFEVDLIGANTLTIQLVRSSRSTTSRYGWKNNVPLGVADLKFFFQD